MEERARILLWWRPVVRASTDDSRAINELFRSSAHSAPFDSLNELFLMLLICALTKIQQPKAVLALLCIGRPIHIGGCNYGYLWKDEPIGWDVAGVCCVFILLRGCGAYDETEYDDMISGDLCSQRKLIVSCFVSTALSDVHDEYVGSCGACYEVKCDNSWTQDNFGEWCSLCLCTWCQI